MSIWVYDVRSVDFKNREMRENAVAKIAEIRRKTGRFNTGRCVLISKSIKDVSNAMENFALSKRN